MQHESKYIIPFFGPSANYYLEKYILYQNGKRYTFNAAAFFLGIFWFIYRKLYWPLFIIILIIVAVGIIEQLIFELFEIDPEAQLYMDFFNLLLFASVQGFCANMIYFKYSDKKIRRILQKTDIEEERLKLLTKEGGVSWAVLYITIFLILLISIMNYSTGGG